MSEHLISRKQLLLASATLVGSLGISGVASAEGPSSVLGPLNPQHAIYAENRNLSADEVARRQADIDESYGQGETLSPADSEFIQTQAYRRLNRAEALAASTSGKVNLTGKAANGATGKLVGVHTMTEPRYIGIRGKWSANLTATGDAKVSKITVSETVRIYGTGATSIK